jgi:hypothetical protein
MLPPDYRKRSGSPPEGMQEPQYSGKAPTRSATFGDLTQASEEKASTSDPTKSAWLVGSCFDCKDVLWRHELYGNARHTFGCWSKFSDHMQMEVPVHGCTLCEFLSSNSSLLAGDESSVLEISLSVAEPVSRWGYSFFPCAFRSVLRRLEADEFGNKEELAREERLILPVIDDGVAAQPSPPYRPLLAEQVDLSVFRAWLTSCIQNHGQDCSPIADGISTEGVPKLNGFRLIECRTLEVVRASLNEQYVALSYVWGDEVVRKARSYPMSTVTPQEHFPRTIQDAVKVALGLGFRYL